MVRPLVVKLTCGLEEPERTNQALTVAATAVASGAEVSLWFTGEAVWLATPGRAATAELPHATPLESLLEVVLAEGTVTACTQCVRRRDLDAGDLLPGVRVAGAAVLVEEVLRDDAQALVY